MSESPSILKPALRRGALCGVALAALFWAACAAMQRRELLPTAFFGLITGFGFGPLALLEGLAARRPASPQRDVVLGVSAVLVAALVLGVAYAQTWYVVALSDTHDFGAALSSLGEMVRKLDRERYATHFFLLAASLVAPLLILRVRKRTLYSQLGLMALAALVPFLMVGFDAVGTEVHLARLYLVVPVIFAILEGVALGLTVTFHLVDGADRELEKWLSPGE